MPSFQWSSVCKFLVIAVALLVLYFPIAKRLVNQWRTDENFSHGWLVPPFSAYVLWEKRKQLAALPSRPSWSGLAVVGFGLLVLAAGVTGAELFLSRVSFLFVLVGLTALTFGWNHVRAAALPISFLLLMIPIPAIVLNQITFPLQRVASILATDILRALGVPVFREGNIIGLAKKSLEVAKACSGLRSLMVITTLAIVYGYLLEPRNSIRLVLALASIPIAVIANSLRIVFTALVLQYGDAEMAEGFYHKVSGWLIFVISIAILYSVHRGLQKFVGEGAR
jgi:exosortase